ncbi:glycosyltransferase [Bacillus sp. FJAT-29953]|nr:glycosyltransferase [Bacillus sp. FJAT-29953]
MKIVHLTIRAGFTDGWAYQENLLAEAHQKLGHEVVVIATTTNSVTNTIREITPNNEYIINGVRIVRLAPKVSILGKRIELYPHLLKTLEEEKPDLIFVHGINFISLKEVNLYKKKHPKCVVLADTHADAGNSMKRFYLLNKYLLQKGLWRYIVQKYISVFDIIYYTTLQSKVFAMDYYKVPEELMRQLPMGGDPTKDQLKNRSLISEVFRKKNGISPETLLLVSGGRFRESKKIYELVSAFKMLNSQDIKLVLFGRFEDQKYQKKVMELVHTDERISFIGWLSPQETTEVFLSSDLAVFSGTQSVIWRNAVACGLPVICRYSFGAEELDVGGNAIHLHTDEPFAWKQILEHLIETPNLLERMKENSIENGIPFFSNDRIAQMIIANAEEVQNK